MAFKGACPDSTPSQRQIQMLKIEQLEMNAQRAQLNADMKSLVEKYRSIFGWNVPEIDETLSDRLIFEALRQALNDIEGHLAKSTHVR
jgi:hypothetical protein